MRTDRISLIGMFMQSVRRLTFKPLVFVAVLSTAAILACKDDPMGPDGTGRLVVRIVPLEEAQPAAGSQAAAHESANAGRTASVTPKAGDSVAVVDAERASDKVLARVAQPPRRDILRIMIQGPTNFSRDYTPEADGSLNEVIPDLAVGTYTVQVWGMDTDLGAPLVSEFGTTSGVTVQEDQIATATIPFGSFLPDIDTTVQTTTSAFRFEIGYRRVPTATGYFAEVDTDPNFSAPSMVPVADTSAVLAVTDLGTFYFRVRAENNMVSASEAKPSDPVAIDVVADLGGPTGDDAATALFLGTVNAATGQYPDFNIYPATDEDWFALDLTTDATLSVEVLSGSLTQPALEMASPEGTASPSDLDPVLDIFNPGLNVIASNDNDVTLEPRLIDVPISTDGRHFIRVTSFEQSTVGHYELVVTVNAPAVDRVEVTPPAATIIPTGQAQLTGRTFDQFDNELFGREALWSSSDDFIATVDGSGLVTGQSLGAATITFASEGISGTATIDVTDVPAAKVVITPRSGLLQGIGQTVQWSAEAFDASDNTIVGKPINWFGANPAVADADAGLVEAFGNGQTIIVAEADGVEGYALVTVTDPSAQAANYWSDGPASGVTEILFDIWGTSSNAMYAVGDAGTILYNDGSGWTSQTSGVGNRLLRVWGIDESTAWAVGSAGVIVSTGDMGATWTLETTPTGETLQGIWGAAINDVFAVGGFGGTGVALHYDGSSWNTMSIPVTTPLNSVWGSATDDVFAVGDAGVILHYDGTLWTPMTSPTAEILRTVWGTSNADVFAVGTNGTIVHYDGADWTDMTDPSVTTVFLRSVWGTSSSEVIAVGTSGTIIQYDGTSWTADVSGTTETLSGVFGLPNPGILAVGGNGTVRLGTRGATVIVTPNPGTIDALGNTLPMSAEVQDNVGTVVASGNIFGWNTSDPLIADIDVNGLVTAIANGTVTITADIAGLSGTADVTVQQVVTRIDVTPQGAEDQALGPQTTFSATAFDANDNPIAGATFTWSSLNPNVATMPGGAQATIVASGQTVIAAELDGTFGYAVLTVAIPGATAVDLTSEHQSGMPNALRAVWGTGTDDVFAVGMGETAQRFDGSGWVGMTTTGSNLDLRGVWGTASNDVFAAAGNGVIHYDGAAWSSATSGFGNQMNAIWGAAPNDVWAAGVGGQVLHFDGSTWGTVVSGTSEELLGLWGAAASDIFFVGNAGTIRHWDGSSFTAQSGTASDLKAVWGAGSADVFAVGAGGAIVRYNGVSWSVMTSGTVQDLYGVWGSSSSDVYAVGGSGTVLRFDGTTWGPVAADFNTEILHAVWGTPNPAVYFVGDDAFVGRGSRGAVLTVSPTSHTFDALGSQQLITATVVDEGGTVVTALSSVPFTWTSTDDLVATVGTDGNVTSTGNGSATIDVSVQGHTAAAAITVSQVAVAFAIVPNSASLAIGDTLQLTGGSLDANNNPLETQPPITWSTSDASIADVDINGLVTAFGLGTATITADDGIGTPATADITVTVPNTAATIAAGDDHSCAIANGGVAYCWGQNSSGQLGDGTTSPSPSPVQVAGGLTFTSIAAGADHSCGLTPDGTAYCWGNNGQGRLGDNTVTTSSTSVAVAGGLQFAEVRAANTHTCGITTTGVPYCWGQGGNGELGDGSATRQGQPVGVTGGHTFQSIATGQNHSCGVDLTGTVYCWGWNAFGQLGDGTTTQRNSPVMASTPGGLVFRAVSAGDLHTCALVDASDGTDPSAVYCWGRGSSGQLGDASNAQQSTPVRTFGAFLFASIEAGAIHTCATTTAGAGLCWGEGYDGEIGNGSFNSINIPTAVSGGLTFAKIMAGGAHSCGRSTGGDVYCWGRNDRGALGTGDGLATQPAFVLGGAASVATGDRHTCVLNSGGSASCFGLGTNGQLGQGSNQNELSPVAVSGGFTFVSVEVGGSHTCGLETSPGDIYCWGSGGSGELGNGSVGSTNAPATKVTGGHSFVEVSGGQGHSCGLTDLGDVYCWGNNFVGQLGNNSTTDSENPVSVSGGNTYTTVTAGRNFTCALTDTGLARCWGWNEAGQLGNATNTNSWVPVAVAGGASFTQIEAGGHVCALGATGTAFCWGPGQQGQLGNNQFSHSNIPQAVAGGFAFTSLAAGWNHTCAIRSNGETMCWGRNNRGELGDGTFDTRGLPTTVSGGHSFADLGVGLEHTCGVTTAGSLYCWGGNDEGELGLGFTSRVGTPVMVAGGLTFVIPPPEVR